MTKDKRRLGRKIRRRQPVPYWLMCAVGVVRIKGYIPHPNPDMFYLLPEDKVEYV